MHGYELDCVFICFETELVFVRTGLTRIGLTGKPFYEIGHACISFSRGLVKDLCKMEQVCVPALSVRQGHQPGQDIFFCHHAFEHPDKAMVLPCRVIGPEPDQPLFPPCFVFCQGIQFLPVDTDHVCCKGRFKKSLIVRLENAGKDASHFNCLMRSKNALRAA